MSDYDPIPMEHPGKILLEELKARDLTIVRLGMITRFNEEAWEDVCEGEAPITPKMAADLANTFGTSADLWINLQANYDKAQTAS